MAPQIIFTKNTPISIYFVLFQPVENVGRYAFPWHENINIARIFMESELYVTHPVMSAILYHFHTKYVLHTFLFVIRRCCCYAFMCLNAWHLKNNILCFFNNRQYIYYYY